MWARFTPRLAVYLPSGLWNPECREIYNVESNPAETTPLVKVRRKDGSVNTIIRHIAPLALTGLILTGTACSGSSGETAIDQSTDTREDKTATTIYYGGAIYTANDDRPSVDAVATFQDRILAIGDDEAVLRFRDPDTVMIDLAGAALFPGFTDAHAHLIGIGERELTLNLEQISSIAELVSIVKTETENAEPGAIIVGRGWIETGWPEGRFPNKSDIDPVSGENPVILTRADGHALLANSAAIQAAHINDETPDPDGGRIERDRNGAATGIFVDKAMNLVRASITNPDEARQKEAFLAANAVYTAYGWTGLHNMSVNPDNISLLETMSDQGDLDLRIYNSINDYGLDELAASGMRTSKNGKTITRAVKLYVDGALGSRGAALSAPYSDAPDTDGLLLLSEDNAARMLAKALANNIQINAHAIGDRGNRLLLDWYETALTENSRDESPRWRIEHAQILHPEDAPRFAKLGVIPSMQPSHAIGDLFFAPARLGAERLDGAYAWRLLLDEGAIIAGGSDAPVERGDPLIEFYAASIRKSLKGFSNDDWRPAQAVTRDEALKMFTLWPAYASFQEHDLGTIEVGKKADFTVFSKDIMTVPAGEILEAKAVMTVVDGEIVHTTLK